jgi:hypothetical protein
MTPYGFVIGCDFADVPSSAFSFLVVSAHQRPNENTGNLQFDCVPGNEMQLTQDAAGPRRHHRELA